MGDLADVIEVAIAADVFVELRGGSFVPRRRDQLCQEERHVGPGLTGAADDRTDLGLRGLVRFTAAQVVAAYMQRITSGWFVLVHDLI